MSVNQSCSCTSCDRSERDLWCMEAKPMPLALCVSGPFLCSFCRLAGKFVMLTPSWSDINMEGCAWSAAVTAF